VTRLLAAGAVLASALAAGWWLGAGRVQGRWDAAELQRERAVAALGAQERRRQHQAAADYEAQAQRIRAQAATPLPEVRNALQSPIPCPGGASATPALVLADVPVPAAVLDGLRAAGADPRPD
jgi:hypothetical protein